MDTMDGALDAHGFSTNAVQRALLEAARALSTHLSVDGACGAALHSVERVFGVRSSWIMLHDAQTRTLRTVLFRGQGSDVYRDLSIPAEPDTVAGRVFTRREAVFVPDVRAETHWFHRERMYQSGLCSLFMLPLVFAARAVGVIALDAPHFSAERLPEKVDIHYLEAFAAQLAIALTNARLYESSEEDRQRLRTLLKERDQHSGAGQVREDAWPAGAGGTIVGESALLADAVHQANLVARADTTVLLLGETGTGKDLLARLIHERSRRSGGPFVAVNCGAIPETLVESELFGHERGAFTGAITRKAGSFELANRGTLFLDEVGDLPLEAQSKLLRVLQDRQVQRIGASKPSAVDVRVIAATNRDLEQAIAEKRFRPDLYYRLSVFPIRIPALRERREDIPPLARHFLCQFTRKLGRNIEACTAEALERLMSYHWPGNIRELQNVIERAVILSRSTLLEPDVLYLPQPAERVLEVPTASGAPPLAGTSTAAPPAAAEDVRTFAEAERQAIVEALSLTGWRISGRLGAAERLGLKPTTLHAKMKKLGIRRPAPVVPPVLRGAGQHR